MNALPEGSVVRSVESGAIWECYCGYYWGKVGDFLRHRDSHEMADQLPALLLWYPRWEITGEPEEDQMAELIADIATTFADALIARMMDLLGIPAVPTRQLVNPWPENADHVHDACYSEDSQ